MNLVIMIGRLTREIELRYTPDGTAIGKTTLAVDRKYSTEKRNAAREKGDQTADFPQIVIMGKQAENAAKYLKKGSKCSIQGELRTSTYKNSQGDTVYRTEIKADKIEYLDSKQESKTEQTHSDFESEDYEVENIPF